MHAIVEHIYYNVCGQCVRQTPTVLVLVAPCLLTHGPKQYSTNEDGTLHLCEAATCLQQPLGTSDRYSQVHCTIYTVQVLHFNAH